MKTRMVVLTAIMLILSANQPLTAQVNNNDIASDEYVTWQDLESGRVDKNGYGLTVFKGTKVEKFYVEYEGVVRHPLFPKEKMILVRMGEPLIGSNVLAGMSGSPVYFKKGNKWCLAGAIAFGYNLPTAGKSLGGITPISAMLYQEKAVGLMNDLNNQTQQQIKLKLLQYRRNNLGNYRSKEIAQHEKMLIETLSQPIELGRYGKGTLQLLQPALTVVKRNQSSNLFNNSRIATPKAGEAVTMMFVEGDISLGATCTITYVSGNKYLACGHPVLGDGKMSVPAYKASIATSYKGPMDAFKMVANQHESLGYISFDSVFAIEGKLEPAPKDAMIPVKLMVSLSGKKPIEVNYKVFRDKLYTSALIGNAADEMLANLWNVKQKATARAVSTIKFDDKTIKLHHAYASGTMVSLGPFVFITGPWTAVTEAANCVGALMSSRLNFKVNEVRVDLNIEPGEKVFTVDAYKVIDKKGNPVEEVKLGSKFDLILGLRDTEGAEQFVIEIPLEIPQKLNIKGAQKKVIISVHVESGNNYLEKDESKLLDHQPENKDEFLKALLVNERDPQKTYIQIVFPKTELEIKSTSTMPANAKNNWVKVQKLDFLRSLKTSERKVIIKEINSPREDFILSINEEITLELNLR